MISASVDSLVAVLFVAGEGLGVDVSQGDVLVPLEVSHQDPDLRLHQANPGGGAQRTSRSFSGGDV